MMSEKKKTTAGNIVRRIARILLRTVLIIVLLLITLLVLIQTPPVQNFIVKKATGYLEGKLHTKVQIGRLYIGFPKDVVVENIYLEDQSKDTLLYGGKIKVDISMLKLLDSEVEVNEVKLEQITAKIKRSLPDTTFNFQYIIDAFASKEPKVEKKEDTTALKLAVKYVQLDKIRLLYNDVVTGNDVEANIGHFDTRIDSIDLARQYFVIPTINLKGLNARVYQSKPLMVSEPVAVDQADAKAPSAMHIGLKNVVIDNLGFDYRNEVSATYANIGLDRLNLDVKEIDLANKLVNLNSFELNKLLAAIRLGKTEAAKVVQKETNQEVSSQADAGWRVLASAIRINENNLKFDNDNEPRQKAGIDYAHINASNLTFHVNDLLYSSDTISGNIIKGNLKEQSGLQVNRLETNFLYSGRGATLDDLILETPGTTIRKSIAVSYPSLDALKKNLGLLQMDINLENSKIHFKDILTLVPTLKSQPAFANPDATLLFTAQMTGTVSRLNVQQLKLSAFNDTRINIRGAVMGLPDMNKAGGNLVISEITTSRRDLMALAPKGSIPTSITIPERIKITGRIAGGMSNIRPDITMITSLGNVTVKGSVQNAADKNKAKYDLALRTTRFDLGTLLKNREMYGPLTARLTAKGRGYDMKTANASIKGIIESMVLKKYNYRNLVLDAGIAAQQLRARAEIHDPNIDFSIDASGNMASKFPAVTLTANIDSIKTFPLHLTTDSIIYRGVITANFPITDPDNLSGDLLITKSLLVKGPQRLELDTVQLSAGQSDSGQFLRLSADAINIALQGKYKLTQMGDVITQAINPYYTISTTTPAKPVDPYDFTFTGSIINKPILTTFVPALTRLEPVMIDGRFSTDNGWTFNARAPRVIYADNDITDLELKAGTGDDSLRALITVGKVHSGKSLAVFNTSVKTSIADNIIDFALNVKDSLTKDKYAFAAIFKQPQPGDYELSVKPQQVLLNYDNWTVPQDNLISILKTDIHARNFILARDGQSLSINSLTEGPNAPLEVAFKSFKIATLANFAVSDSLPVDGIIDGKAVLTNLTSQPVFETDLTLSDVSFKKDTIGTVKVLVNNTVKDTYAANVTITGHQNDVALVGNYYVRPDSNSSFDMNLDIRSIYLNTIEGATMGAIKNSQGYIAGKFAINGTTKAPSVNGNLDFKGTAFNLAMLNSYFRIDDESIRVNNEGIKFDSFTIKDSTNNSAVLDGMVYYNPGYTDYRFDLTLKAENFRALNTTKLDNKVYYGQLFFNSNLRIKGTQIAPVVDGSLAINDDTKLSIVLPQKEPGIEARKGIVEFVDMDAIPNDSLFMASYDSINKSEVLGLDVAVNINVSKEAEFNIIVDEGNGDFLQVKGEAALSGGIDPSGKITLAGSYELNEGAYELSFNFLHRRFEIQPGSVITWTGEPTKANIDITANYIAKTAPLDLVSSQLTGTENTEAEKNYYRQKLPFQVNLIIKGEMLQPQLSFDIVLPQNGSYNLDKLKINTIDTRLAIIRQEPSELNKQVFALLLLGRFVTDNPFASSNSGFSAESFARNSVSQLLTEQLNNLASDLIQGVDINFDVASTTDDYTTGKKSSRTDLNVALSKRLLNDRLTVSIGSNFELEGSSNAAGGKQRTNNLAGNVSVDYKLSKDGKYALRAYRKNEFEGVVDGYVVETGVGFVINLEYNKFSQIFLSKKQKDQRREMRRQEREDRERSRDNSGSDSTNRSSMDDRRKDTKPTNEEKK